MKTLPLYKTLFTLLTLVGLFFTSCKKDDGFYINPGDTKVVVGEYSGSVSVQGKSPQATSITINDTTMILKDIPMFEIIASVIKDTNKAQDAVNKIGKQNLEIGYTSILDENKNIEFINSPKTITFDIQEDGKTKKVVVSYKTKDLPIYNTKTKNLNFDMETSQITVDGQVMSSASIKFTYTNLIKK
ncbi:DUF4840 domain-containing protein [Siphonobacter sp. SORGH_AS_1065]|uniref:DUF4840 domain-containing protein n=1 Tax=Siphonobacter sp. SORGH_AS_1065 TaxID=3041795 RepID=UPI002789EAD2|nr:DUF4840 domain-containing protein [Siphonobacter sp. SORGH_AS_1065]MDQ1090584.1 archaellum component FlaG (FlaF/FlaG flagellin family) [Siphonobacter sp. SORGH_AS_1065]